MLFQRKQSNKDLEHDKNVNMVRKWMPNNSLCLCILQPLHLHVLKQEFNFNLHGRNKDTHMIILILLITFRDFTKHIY